MQGTPQLKTTQCVASDLARSFTVSVFPARCHTDGVPCRLRSCGSAAKGLIRSSPGHSSDRRIRCATESGRPAMSSCSAVQATRARTSPGRSRGCAAKAEGQRGRQRAVAAVGQGGDHQAPVQAHVLVPVLEHACAWMVIWQKACSPCLHAMQVSVVCSGLSLHQPLSAEQNTVQVWVPW